MYILRVISGSARGHKLKTVPGNTTRPTSDRVKESLFNILSPYLQGAVVLDLFAGTGNLGIEALSRGARSAVFVDKSSECAGIIQDNLTFTKLEEHGTIMTLDVGAALNRLAGKGSVFDLIFLDPPYHKNLVNETLNLLLIHDIMKTDSIIIAEHDAGDAVPEEAGCLQRVRSQKYGDTVVSFYIPRQHDKR